MAMAIVSSEQQCSHDKAHTFDHGRAGVELDELEWQGAALQFREVGGSFAKVRRKAGMCIKI